MAERTLYQILLSTKAPKNYSKGKQRQREPQGQGGKKRTIKKFDSGKLTDMVSDLEDLKLHQNPLAKLTLGRTNHPDPYLELFKVLGIPRAACTSGIGMR